MLFIAGFWSLFEGCLMLLCVMNYMFGWTKVSWVPFGKCVPLGRGYYFVCFVWWKGILVGA